MATVTIRPARIGDAAAIQRLIVGNARFHGKPELAKLTVETVRRDGFGEEPLFWAFLALKGAAFVGIAQYYFIYRGWQAARALYVSDLFVEAEARGQGVGRKLMAAVAGRARQTGCGSLRLGVQRDNSARAFYERLGMTVHDDTAGCQLEGEALLRLAAAR